MTEADIRKVYSLRKLASDLDRQTELRELIIMQNSREKADIEAICGGDSELFCLKYLVAKLSRGPVVK